MSTDISRVANAQPGKIVPMREASSPAADVSLKASNAKSEAPPAVKFDAEAQRKNIQKTLEELNNQMKQTGRNLNFKMDNVLNMPIVTVTNSQTGEVIRQIPSEVVVRVAHNLEDLKGMLHNETT
jgi:flagellar protein FlaG